MILSNALKAEGQVVVKIDLYRQAGNSICYIIEETTEEKLDKFVKWLKSCEKSTVSIYGNLKLFDEGELGEALLCRLFNTIDADDEFLAVIDDARLSGYAYVVDAGNFLEFFLTYKSDYVKIYWDNTDSVPLYTGPIT